MFLQVVAKKFDNGWHGASIVDGKFQDTMADTDLNTLVGQIVSRALNINHPVGTTVTVDVRIDNE